MSFDNILHIYKDLYYNLPQSLKTFLGELYGNIPLKMRFGKPYNTHLKTIRKLEKSGNNFLEEYIYNKTLETLIFAERYIPYYKKKFSEYNVNHKCFKELKDINKFPYLTKNDLKSYLNTLYTKRFEKPTPYFTGGSTSVPTKYYLPLFTSRGKEKAYNTYIFSKIGYNHRDRTVLLKGRETAMPNKNIYWEYEPVDNYLVISSNYLNSNVFNLIHSEVLKFQPKFFFGYPSAIIDYIKSAQRNGIEGLKLKGVILTSEMVYDEEMKMIQDFYNCPILVKYGHTERCIVAYKINNNKYFPVNSYGLFVEGSDEIVGTSFDNFVMPFVNYCTNDFIYGTRLYINDSDVVQEVDGIEGRLQEYLVSKDYRLISICVLGAGHYSSLSDVDAIQYHQEKPGEATLLVESNNAVDVQHIKKELEDFTKNAIDISVVPVSSIEKSGRGKRVLCKQELNIQEFR